MRKAKLVTSGIVFCFCLCGAYSVYAQQEGSSAANLGQEINSDRQQIKAQKLDMSQNAQAARAEENNLRQQIQAAVASGDMATANKLKEQLRATHQENLLQKQQDMQAMRDSRKELSSDINQVRQQANPPGPVGGPGVGPIDRDNNPPGPAGGAGTNWENRPGPQGGPGASPNIRPQANPPGPAGGPGAGQARNRGRR